MTKNDYLGMISTHGANTKLGGFRSLSTSPLLNPLCMGRHFNPKLICYHCYSVTYNKLREGLKNKLARNTEILTTEVIPYESIPVINDRYFRIESFGDLQNATQAINYLNLIRKNPETNFGWWTKNPNFIKQALKALNIEKPENVQIILSACALNVEIKLETVKRSFSFVDKVFTVYDKKYINANNIQVNCGTRKCIDCLNCYRSGGYAQVNEKKK